MRQPKHGKTMVYVCEKVGHITVNNYDSMVGVEADGCCQLCDQNDMIEVYAADDLRKGAWKL